MPFIFGFIISFVAVMVIGSLFLKPLMKLLIYFVIYIILPVLLICGGAVLLFTGYFALKVTSKKSLLDFGLLLLLISAEIASAFSWGVYLLAYTSFLLILSVVAFFFTGLNMLFTSYQKLVNSEEYLDKKAKKEQIEFEKKYEKTRILLENQKKQALAHAKSDDEISSIESRSESLKNAFEFLASEHKIIINSKDIKAINQITNYFALSNGNELKIYEQAYKEILARHKVAY